MTKSFNTSYFSEIGRRLRDLILDSLRHGTDFLKIKQNWLGFSFTGNKGSGLGSIFADSLYTNLGRIFESFGQEKITQGSHLEKLCLVASRVGRDNISDFTTNLIPSICLNIPKDLHWKT